MIGKVFTLHQAPKKDDPFTIYYPIEITRPGRVYISVSLKEIIPQPQGNMRTPLHATLVDARAFNISEASWKKWTKKTIKYAEYAPGGYVAVKILEEVGEVVEKVAGLFGKKKEPPAWYHGSKYCRVTDYRSGLSFGHSVDSHELEKTKGRYVLLFRNYSTRHRGNGKIFISYPGDYSELDKTVEKEMKCHPDLVINSVSLDANKRLQVSVANKQCLIHPARWKAVGPDGSGEAKSIMKHQASVTEGYVNGLASAKNADEVIDAIERYTEGMKKLIPELQEFQKNYPEYKQGKLPKGMEADVKRIEESSAKMPEAMMKVTQYMMDPRVQEAMTRMGNEMGKFE